MPKLSHFNFHYWRRDDVHICVEKESTVYHKIKWHCVLDFNLDGKDSVISEDFLDSKILQIFLELVLWGNYSVLSQKNNCHYFFSKRSLPAILFFLWISRLALGRGYSAFRRAFECLCFNLFAYFFRLIGTPFRAQRRKLNIS